MRNAIFLLLIMFVVGCAGKGPVTAPEANKVDAAQINRIFNGPIDSLVFGPGDHRLDAAARDRLGLLVNDLQQHESVVISLGGHTDNRGSARDNLELSKRRVMSVVRYLVSNGIDAERLKPFGYGESQPVVSNATSEGRAQNRRIELSVVSQ